MSKNPFDEIKNAKPQQLDKFQLATNRFIDTLHAYLSGYSPATIIDNVRATCEVMNGIIEHLKNKQLLPSDISLTYSRKTSPEEEPNDITTLTDDMYKSSRIRSNFAKHADRDALKTLSYDTFLNVDHFIFNMTVDYEIFHCALMNQGLLDRSNEELYPIKSTLLNGFYKYKEIYYQQYDVPGHGKASSNPMIDFQLRLQRAIELYRNDEECLVPAGTAACAIFRDDEHYFNPKYRAQQFKELGFWPVDTQTNARFTKEIVPRPEDNLEM